MTAMILATKASIDENISEVLRKFEIKVGDYQ
jgi:hypothetical protein